MGKTLVKPDRIRMAFRPINDITPHVTMFCGTSVNNNKTRAELENRCFGTAHNDASVPDYGAYKETYSLNGLLYVYSGGDIVANVGLQNFNKWIREKTVLEFKKDIGEGAELITEKGECIVLSVNESLSAEGNSTYAIDIAVRGIPEVTLPT